MNWIDILGVLRAHPSLIITVLVVVFTGLYWWDTRRAYLLELDRVTLWFRLEERKKMEAQIKEVLETTLDKQIEKKLDEYPPLKEMEKKLLNEGGLTPQQRKKIENSIRSIRKKTHEEIREGVIESIQKELAIERDAGDLAFFNTLKSKKLSTRLTEYRKERKKLLLDMKKQIRLPK